MKLLGLDHDLFGVLNPGLGTTLELVKPFVCLSFVIESMEIRSFKD